MASLDTRLPRPEIKGEGRVRYRCARCEQLMEPDEAVIVQGKSYHPEHQPIGDPNGR